MSLETEIKKLTASIDALNANMFKLLNVPVANDPVLAGEILDREMPKAIKEKEAVVEVAEVEPEVEVVAEVEPELTTQDVIDLLGSMSRKAISAKDKTFKPKVKALLAKYSASKVTDLDLDQLAAFKAGVLKL